MAYCTSSDVQLRVGGAAKLLQLADHNADGVADTGLIDAAIAEADALINSYASKRFSVPLATPPATLVALSAKIAARILRRWRLLPLPSDESDEVIDQKWLSDLAKGGVLPGVEPIPEQGDIVTDTTGERESTKIVSRNALRGLW